MDQVVLVKKGQTVRVSQKITEGKKDRIVAFRGTVVKVRGSGLNMMFTVRQTLEGIEVDRIFPILAPTISKIEIIEEKKIQPGSKNRKKAKKKSASN